MWPHTTIEFDFQGLVDELAVQVGRVDLAAAELVVGDEGGAARRDHGIARADNNSTGEGSATHYKITS